MKRLELPTLLLGLVIYALWLALTYHFHNFPVYLGIPMAAIVVTWQSSLQHECVHDHPSDSALLNSLFAGFALWLYLPFRLYQETHLEHHDSAHLTSPNHDTESFYFTSERWQSFGVVRRAFWTAHNTVLGRFLLGPIVVLYRVASSELSLLLQGRLDHVRYWVAHAFYVAAILWWATEVCDLALWEYLLYFVYPGMSLSLLRSFAEHRPAASQMKRSAIIETGPLWSLLFLSNNLHLLHHKVPDLAWYRMQARYRSEREILLTQNGNFVYDGYGEIVRRFLVQPAASPVHPTETR